MNTAKLGDLSKLIRSKNSSVYRVTFDIVFPDKRTYEMVKRSAVLSPELVCSLYGIPANHVTSFMTFDVGNAYKFTLQRRRPSGDLGETDVRACQQYSPLLDVEIPLPTGWAE